MNLPPSSNSSTAEHETSSTCRTMSSTAAVSLIKHLKPMAFLRLCYLLLETTVVCSQLLPCCAQSSFSAWYRSLPTLAYVFLLPLTQVLNPERGGLLLTDPLSLPPAKQKRW